MYPTVPAHTSYARWKATASSHVFQSRTPLTPRRSPRSTKWPRIASFSISVQRLHSYLVHLRARLITPTRTQARHPKQTEHTPTNQQQQLGPNIPRRVSFTSAWIESKLGLCVKLKNTANRLSTWSLLQYTCCIKAANGKTHGPHTGRKNRWDHKNGAVYLLYLVVAF